MHPAYQQASSRSRTPLMSPGRRLQSDTPTAFASSSFPGAYYTDMNLITSRIGTRSVSGGIPSSVMRPDPVADRCADDEQTNSVVDEADVFGGGFDIFMSGITIHFKPLRYDHIRDWVVNKLGGVYAGIQNAGIADVENGLIFPSFVRRLSEDGSSQVHNHEDGERETTDGIISQGSGSELSFLFNTVSGIYYLLNPSDDHTVPQTSGTPTSAVPDVIPTERAHDRCPEVLAPEVVDAADKAHLQPEIMNSFDSISGEEDYDVLYLDEEDGSLDETRCASISRPGTTLMVRDSTGDPGIIEAGDTIDESEKWDVVSQDEVDDWDIPVRPS
ncbi:hypothetical protein V1520DRAFT_336774 [Lipomyces starkeyi]|uniref:Uncharacterized protein n=1 Tax=Lipomyces starkeyi NRRL Y-11557 TaxID=675824 RepID=A0A1E3Q1J4_LIPST|nr:hypothetical protein LIPSTDRAFT_325919 [Lipomyces starkeyi NRRL Y-11557]